MRIFLYSNILKQREWWHILWKERLYSNGHQFYQCGNTTTYGATRCWLATGTNMCGWTGKLISNHVLLIIKAISYCIIHGTHRVLLETQWFDMVGFVSLLYGVLRHFQQYFIYIVAVSFNWWRKPKYQEKTTDLSQITDKILSHNVASSTPRLSGIRTNNFSGDRHWLDR